MMLSQSEKYQQIRKILNERQWRQFLAIEVGVVKNVSQLSQLAKTSINTIKKGIKELGTIENTLGERIRKVGGGPKKIADTDLTFKHDLESLLDPKGDPMSLVLWTTKSLNKLVEALEHMGHHIKKSALANYLRSEGYSLKANKKNIEGKSHPDRDEQFKNLKKQCDLFKGEGYPIISVDCKKKELIGNFKNQGREWISKDTNTIVNVYDYLSIADGKAAPYEVYDVIHNKGFVNVGVDHDTAEFAVESIRRWWNNDGKLLFSKAKKILITADGGGSNGSRNRLWKIELQKLANETNLEIVICHYPPATSKWNLIEHRLFSFISINWRARPLVSFETIIELLNHTSTKEGLTVVAIKDDNKYEIGKKISDKELASINIHRDQFHPEWNYTIKPNL